MTIRRVTFIRSVVVAAALIAVGASSPSHPAAAAASANCIPVGGTFMTNLGAIGGTSVPSTMLGRVTGDLSGAVAATIANVQQSGGNFVFTVQHHIVTDEGDFVYANEAQATAMQVRGAPQPLFAIVTYPVQSQAERGSLPMRRATLPTSARYKCRILLAVT